MYSWLWFLYAIENCPPENVIFNVFIGVNISLLCGPLLTAPRLPGKWARNNAKEKRTLRLVTRVWFDWSSVQEGWIGELMQVGCRDKEDRMKAKEFTTELWRSEQDGVKSKGWRLNCPDWGTVLSRTMSQALEYQLAILKRRPQLWNWLWGTLLYKTLRCINNLRLELTWEISL